MRRAITVVVQICLSRFVFLPELKATETSLTAYYENCELVALVSGNNIMLVTSPATSHLPHSYSLHWTAGSLQPLTETRLLLREVAHNYFYILNSHGKPIKAFKSRSFATMWHFDLVFSPLRTLQCRWGRGTGPT